MSVCKLQACVIIFWGITAPLSIARSAESLSASPSTPLQQAGDESPELMLFKDMPVVVAAGMREQTQDQAAAAVSVVTAEDIQLFGYRNLADVLRGQRGFYLQTDGLNWFAGVRGFLRPGEWNARLLVLVDGRPTRENIFGQSHLDQDFVVPMETVKRIEVVRGPGSALYGGNAIFGVVNVVTKDGADVNGLQATIQGGTQQTGRISAMYGTVTKDGWDIIGALSGFSSQGDGDISYDDVHDAAHNFGHIRGFDYEGAYAGYFKAHKGDFTAEFDYEGRQRDNRTARYLASWFDPGTLYEDRTNITLRFDHEIAKGQSIHAKAYFGHYDYSQYWFYPDDGHGHPYRYTTEARNDWLGEEIHYDWQVSRTFHLLVGGDATQALFTRQMDLSAIDGTVLDVNPSYNAWGVFAEGEMRVTPWLSLTAGLRLDDVQRVGTLLSPRFAAVFTPTRSDSIKALYGQAFRAPNLYEMFYSSAGANTPNPNLKPEICDTYELVWERQFSNGWHTSLGGFLWKMSSAMDGVTLADGSVQIQNGQDLWAHGVEAEIQKQWYNGARVRAYATFTEATKRGIGLDNSPEWIVGGAAAVPVFGKNTFLAVEPQIVGPMKSDLGQYTGPTFITNVVLTSRDVVKGLDLQLGIYNLFARNAVLPHTSAADHFQPTLNYPEAQLLLSLTYRF